MPRTTTRTRAAGRKRPAATDEQRAESARRAAELRDRADAAIADTAAVKRLVRTALGQMSPRVLGYSLRNQLLLMEQADERGIALTDVDTFKGWRERGRGVRRGETGLRIIRPVGTAEPETGGDHDGESAPAAGADGEEAAARALFRVMTVFEVSQTDGPDTGADDEGAPQHAGACGDCSAEPGEPCRPGCLCPGCDPAAGPEPIGSPGALLWANLTEQITRAGYAIDQDADTAVVATDRLAADHDRQVLHLGSDVSADARTLADLATVLADILTRADQRRAATRRKQAPRQIQEVPTEQQVC